jgi:hypothetical protein
MLSREVGVGGGVVVGAVIGVIEPGVVTYVGFPEGIVGAGDIVMEPCAVRVARAHVPVVRAVVTVVVVMGTVFFPAAARTIALVLGVL